MLWCGGGGEIIPVTSTLLFLLSVPELKSELTPSDYVIDVDIRNTCMNLAYHHICSCIMTNRCNCMIDETFAIAMIIDLTRALFIIVLRFQGNGISSPAPYLDYGYHVQVRAIIIIIIRARAYAYVNRCTCTRGPACGAVEGVNDGFQIKFPQFICSRYNIIHVMWTDRLGFKI